MGAEINTPSDDMFPFIHKNGHLYFASSGRQGMGGLDLFEAFKKDDGSYTVLNMGYPINSNNDDFGVYLAEDGIHGYFASNRPGGKGDDDIYRFIVTNPIKLALDLEGDVTDAMDGHKLDSSNVVLTLADGTNPQPLNTGSLNTFGYEIKPDLKYKVEVTRKGYNSATVAVDPEKRPENSDVVKVPVVLEKIQEWGIYGNVYIRGTKEVVPGVTITIKRSSGELYSTVITPEVEGFRTKLEPNMGYEIVFEKKGFLTTKGNYSTVGRKPGYVDINEFIDVSIEKIDMNKTIEVNIYYDLGKWNIRKDAAVELDKVVAFLTDNPEIKVELGSHTDARGDAASNQSLSQKRADSAVAYIIGKGISKDRIVAKGYGESKLKNQCADGVKCSEAEHQQNRRTEIRITSF
jgi:outer membrane protein OmpA-like peptidoglycan-associated protein